jgi:4-amino-4-deoxy-L-arabinose transferase-like glycosyltransferase
MALSNSLMRDHLVRITPEPALTFLLLLALLLAVVGARQARYEELPARWAVGAGLALGLALQAKLTATFSFVAFGVWASLIAAAAVWRRYRRTDRATPGVWIVTRGWLLVIAVALATFVVTNPHLYRNPISHTLHLFEERVTTMETQHDASAADDRPGNAVERVRYVLGGSLVMQPRLDDGPALAWRGVPVAALFAPFGVLLLLSRTWRYWTRSLRLPVDAFVLVTALVYVAAIAVTLHVYWSRYLVPTFVFGSLLAGIGVGVVSDWIRTSVTRRAAMHQRRVPL